MWFGPLCRLWLWQFRVRGGLVCPYRWFAFGVGFGRSVWRRFRLPAMLVRAWCWFAFAPSRLVLDLVVLIVRRFRFICSLVRRLVLVGPVVIRPKVRSKRRMLVAFK